MSEMQMVLNELNRLRERVAHLETRQEHPGFAASDVARLSEDNTFTGAVNTFDNDVDVDGDLAVGGDATITGTVQAAAAWIPGVAVSLNAKLYCGFNGNEPYETTYTGSSTGHRSQTGTETGGVIYRPGKFGKAVQVAEDTTNKVLNPVAGAAGNIAALGAATVTLSSTTKYWIHSTSLKLVTTAAANDGADYTLSALTNAVHYVTIRTDVAWATQEWSLNGGTNWRTPTLLSSDDAGWYVYGYSFLAADANGSTSFDIRQTVATVRTVYIGHVQVEAKAYPTPPCHGALGSGHSWSGTAHASASSRTHAVITYSKTILDNVIYGGVGTISAWAKHGSRYAQPYNNWLFSTSTNITVSNRNIEFYFARGATGHTPAVAVNGKIYTQSGTAITYDEWHHYAMVWDGTSTYVYVDGVQFGATIADSPSLVTYADLRLGELANSDNYVLNGLIDDFVILSRYADADEIRAIYESQCALSIS